MIDDFYYDDIACDLNISADKVRLIVDFCCKWSLFDHKLLTGDKLLSSVGIQSRFQEMVKTRAKNRIIEVPQNVWILSEKDTEGYIKVIQNSDLSGNNDNKFRKNDNKFGKNHTKESKVKESKVKESKVSVPDEAGMVLQTYRQLIGQITPSVSKSIEGILKKGMEPELVVRIIEYACEQGEQKRNWQYIKAALAGNLNEGILTLEDYLNKQKKRTETKGTSNKQSRSKFNNYNDTNRHDYSKMQQELLEQMLEDD